MKNQYINNANKPLIIGFAGRAGSGKTSVAESIVPKGSLSLSKHGVKWDHIFFALPLYELASAKKNIKGFNQASRRLYAIHDVLYDLFGGSPIGDVPSYDELTKMVHQVYDLEIEPEGVKPRTFLQKAGDLCRDFDKDCFTKWAIRKSNLLYRKYITELSLVDLDSYLGESEQVAIIISDVRFENEAQAILDQPNGIVVYFDASDQTLNERILKRDGKPMTSEQLNHKSEKYIENIKNIATVIISSDNMSVEEQANATLKQIGIIKEQHAKDN